MPARLGHDRSVERARVRVIGLQIRPILSALLIRAGACEFQVVGAVRVIVIFIRAAWVMTATPPTDGRFCCYGSIRGRPLPERVHGSGRVMVRHARHRRAVVALVLPIQAGERSVPDRDLIVFMVFRVGWTP